MRIAISFLAFALCVLPLAAQGVIISEIMYNPSGTEMDQEWVEIYNPTASTVNLDLWFLQDEEGATGGIPIGSSIAPGEAIVLIPDTASVADFVAAWGTAGQIFQLPNWGNLAGLDNSPSASNEVLELRSTTGLEDRANFSDDAPWPTDSGSQSIYVIGGALNLASNDLGQNWFASVSGRDGGVTSTIVNLFDGVNIASPGFVETTPPPPPVNGAVLISEILSNSAGAEPDQEWVEIYNASAMPLNIGGWFLEDEDGPTAALPMGTMIAPGEAIIICPDLVTAAGFQSAWPSAASAQVFPVANWTTPAPNGLGNLANGPSATNEVLTIRDAAGVLQDVVNFDDVAPWPGDPSGISFYLTAGNVDAISNDNGANWASSFSGIDGAVSSLVMVGAGFTAVDVGSPGFVQANTSLASWPGNGTDAATEVSVNGVVASAPSGVFQIQAQDFLTARFSSPNGTLDGAALLVIGDLQFQGSPFGPITFPGDPAGTGVWSSPRQRRHSRRRAHTGIPHPFAGARRLRLRGLGPRAARRHGPLRLPPGHRHRPRTKLGEPRRDRRRRAANPVN